MFYYKIRQTSSGVHPFLPAPVFPALSPHTGGEPTALRVEEAAAAHCALEVVVEAAPPAEATVKREFWADSAEVEAA